MEDLFLSGLANVPEAVGAEGEEGETQGTGRGGRAQLWSQIAALEPGQRRQRPGRPCVLVVSLRSLFPPVCVCTPQCDCVRVAQSSDFIMVLNFICLTASGTEPFGFAGRGEGKSH